MRIQAVHLMQSGARSNVQAALDLLNLCLAEYAPDATELEELHQARGGCFEQLGQANAALDAYRLALQARRAAPGVQTTAPLDFAYLVVREHRTDLYVEAMDALTQYVEPVVLLFPDTQYRYCAASAIIAQETGETARARDFASKALQAASKTGSGLSYHPDVGVVTNIDRDIERRLKKIVSGGWLGWIRIKQ